LDGNIELPKLPPPFFPKPIVPSYFIVDEELAAKGAAIYGKCSSCHGDNMFGGGMAPDLRASAISLQKTSFAAVVKEGIFTERGMPKFPDITDEQLDELMHFIRKRAKETMPVYEELISKK
jgi:quinohemoprotein ethanol dehydrogenase